MPKAAAFRFALVVLVLGLTGSLAWRAAAQDLRIQYGETVTGTLAAGEADTWRFGSTAGDRVAILVERTEGDLVPTLAVQDAAGETLLNVTWPPEGAPGATVTLTLAAGGETAITVRGQANTAGSYRLRLVLDEAGSALATVDVALSYGQTVHSAIDDEQSRETWSFRGAQGDVLDLHLTPTSGTLAPVLALLGPAGNVLAITDETVTKSEAAAIYSVRLPLNGIYTVVARRAGSNAGAGGTTAGEYDLTVTLRNAAATDTAFVPVPIAVGERVQGRLTAAAPTALYSLNGSGVLALLADLHDDAAPVSVTVMDENRGFITAFSGVGHPRTAIVLGAQRTIWLEVTSPDVRANAPVIFELLAAPLREPRTGARGLVPGIWQQSAEPTTTEPDVWFFEGRAGELVTLAVQPDTVTTGTTVQITDPQGLLLAQRRLDSGLVQPLALAQDGLYEVAVRGSGSDGYGVLLTRRGLDGLAFEQIPVVAVRGSLGETAWPSRSGTLTPGTAEQWMLDITQPRTWHFELDSAAGGSPLILSIAAPDGTLLAQGVTAALSGQGALDVPLTAPGRYSITVAAPPGVAEEIEYTVRGQPVTGGALLPDETAKGALLPEQPVNRWRFTALAGTRIAIALDALDGAAAPELFLARPDGLLAGLAVEQTADGLQASATVEASGEYTLIVRQADATARTAYHVTLQGDTAVAPAPALAAVTPQALAEMLAAPQEATPAPVRVDPADQVLAATPKPNVLNTAALATTGVVLRGAIASEETEQAWRLQVQADDKLSFTAVALAGEDVPDLAVVDEDGAVVAQSVHPDGRTNTLVHRFDAAGRYDVVVRLAENARYALWIDDLSALGDEVRGVAQGRVIAFGETARGELLGADDARTFYFFAHSGDVIRATAASSGGESALRLRLEMADGVALGEVAADDDGSLATIDGQRIALDGLYRLVVTADALGVDGAAFTLHLTLRETNAAARHDSALVDGATGLLGFGEMVDEWLFAAEAGERVTIAVEPLGGGLMPLTVQLADTAGDPFIQRQTFVGAPVAELRDVGLPRDGVYRLIVRAGRGGQGQYRVIFTRDEAWVADAPRALRYNQTVGRVLDREDYLDIWTFAGTQGDMIAVDARATRGDPALLSFQLRSQAGDVVATVASNASGHAVARQIALPETGHYTLAIGTVEEEFSGALVYELTAQLEDTSAQSMGDVLTYGARGAGAFGGDDLRDVWLFEGAQGDIVNMRVESAGAAVAASVLSTDWHVASTAGRADVLAVSEIDQPGELALDPIALPATGVYAVHVSAPPGAEGTYTLWLDGESPAAVPSAPITLPQQLEGTLSAANLVDAWTFEGARGDSVSIHVAADSRGTLAPVVTLYDAEGRVLAQSSGEARGDAQIEAFPLDAPGRYVVAVSRRLGAAGATAGRYRLEIVREPAPDAASRLLRYGQVGRSRLDAAAPDELWTFEGAAGDVIEVRVSVTSGTLDPVLRLYDPDGALVATVDDGDGADAHLTQRLPADGTYTMEVTRFAGRYGATQGNYSLALTRLYRFAPMVPDAVIAYGQQVTGAVDNAVTSAARTFSGAAGDVVDATIDFPTDDAPLGLVLLDPAGNTLASGARTGGQAAIEGYTLPVSGLYTLDVRRPGDARSAYSPYTLDLVLVGAEPGAAAQGGLLQWSVPVVGLFEQAPQTHLWQFRAELGQALVLSLVRLEGLLDAEVALLAPDGSIVLAASPDPAAAALTSEALTLPQAGLYTVAVTAGERAAGLRYRLSLHPLESAAMTE